MPPTANTPTAKDYGTDSQAHQFSYRLGESDVGAQRKAIDEARGEESRMPVIQGAIHIPFLDRLKALPTIRQIPWRPGQELPPERSIESPRVQQRGALLLVTRGQRVEEPCTHCAAGYGRFSECITLENWFQGACSGCIFTSKGNKCSLRFETSGNVDGRALRHHSSNPEMLRELLDSGKQMKPAKKRKRKSAPVHTEQLVDTSFPSVNQQYGSSEGQSPDMDTLLQAEIARGESSGEMEPADMKQKKQRKRTMPYGLPAEHKRNSSWGYQHSTETRNGLSQRKEVLQPPEQLWPARPALDEPYAAGPEPWPEQINVIVKAPTAVINSLPRAKQREIYGLVSGIQGGIDHLQKQLNGLKSSLGIEEEGKD